MKSENTQKSVFVSSGNNVKGRERAITTRGQLPNLVNALAEMRDLIRTKKQRVTAWPMVMFYEDKR